MAKRYINIDDKRKVVCCEECKFYPLVCGYWHKEIREKHPNATFLSATTKHNCQDFEAI